MREASTPTCHIEPAWGLEEIDPARSRAIRAVTRRLGYRPSLAWEGYRVWLPARGAESETECPARPAAEIIYLPDVGRAGILTGETTRWLWCEDPTEAVFRWLATPFCKSSSHPGLRSQHQTP